MATITVKADNIADLKRFAATISKKKQRRKAKRKTASRKKSGKKKSSKKKASSRKKTGNQ